MAGLLFGALMMTLAAGEDRHDTKVEVDGARYRVTTTGQIVTVARKSFIVQFNIEERDRMRKAVRVATGCNVVDEIPNGAKLRGKLDCPAKPAPATP
ncbi:hypothetical protein COA17_07240 [Sphingomonas ginsenosidimutans]|jgi:hypothetical protein|uniref:Uncharacterized protein n=1 Tax=Sphingomonas ginsenosidimutans TaxID=862134 RepID=A0A2A4HYN9_9SPHN|nr:hypothetical protein [Sphingomonas ginsenosidimutans]PCG09646.1 hypothetical protein COA17_07240 [Sphingomonas ginsenosidimutans]